MAGRTERGRKEHRRKSAERADQEQGGHCVHQGQHDEHGETTGRRADQVDAVDQRHRPRAAGQGKRNRHPCEEIRDQQDQDQLEPQQQRHRQCREEKFVRDIQHYGRNEHQSGNYHGKSECRGNPNHIFQQALAWKPRFPEINKERAARHSEHRHAYGEESQVVIGDDRQNPSLDDLKHQPAHADQEQACEEMTLGCCIIHSPSLGCPRRDGHLNEKSFKAYAACMS